MSEPISESLLVHTAILTPAGSEDAYGNPTAGTPVTLTKIRVSQAKQSLVNALGEAKNDKLVLIYDCTFSLPAGTTFKSGDMVEYKSQSYRVREVYDPSGDSAGAHHYRVALVGA